MTTSALESVTFRSKPFLTSWAGLTILNALIIIHWGHRTDIFSGDVLWIKVSVIAILIVVAALPSLLIAVVTCGAIAVGLDIISGHLRAWHVIGALAALGGVLGLLWVAPWILDVMELIYLVGCVIASIVWLAKRMIA